MKKYLTKDDLLDVYIKGKQRGFDFILSKFQLKGSKRTVSAFNESAKSSSNWNIEKTSFRSIVCL